MQIIAFDSHKRYTLALVETKDGRKVTEQRINHQRGNITDFLCCCQKGSPVAVETIGNWYWIVDEIEQAGMQPRLVHARKAKLMLGSINKTDKLDVRGLNKLQRTGTLPVVWIPPGDLRDKRELPRTRMVFAVQRTRLKNRVHSVLAKYGLQGDFEGISENFGKAGRERLGLCMEQLPAHTCYTLHSLLRQLDRMEREIGRIEKRMEKVFERTEQVGLLETMPGVARLPRVYGGQGPILSVVISLEVGDVGRFGSAGQMASYAGTTPRVHASGDKVRYGRLRPDVNRYLKWAFSEAGNLNIVNKDKHPHQYVVGLYNRVRGRRGHATAVGALARHLAESAYWILTKKEPYLERGTKVFAEGSMRA